MITDKTKHKVKILSFWEKHGLSATIDAFPVKRSTLFSWKQTLKKNNGKLESLNDKSKSPHKKRKRIVDARIQGFIITQRTEHPGLGKDKIKSLLCEYCLKENIKIISESTIGRIIQDLKEKRLIPTNSQIYLSGRTGKLIERKPKKKRKKLRRKNYKPRKQIMTRNFGEKK